MNENDASKWLDETLQHISQSAIRLAISEAKQAAQRIRSNFPAGTSCPIDWNAVPGHISVDLNNDNHTNDLFAALHSQVNAAQAIQINVLIDMKGSSDLQLVRMPCDDVTRQILILLKASAHVLVFPDDCSWLLQLSSVGSGYFGTKPLHAR